jgi:hypothetical protein
MRFLAATALPLLLGCLGGCGSTTPAARDGGVADGGVPADGGAPLDGGGCGCKVDGGQDGGANCGDARVMSRYSACLQAASVHDQAACEAAGGTWTQVGLAPSPECVCPTGQGGCACTRRSQCLGACVGQMPGGMQCTGVTQGTCAPASIVVGCWCFFDETSNPTALCVD